jgi:hypothetical protein
MVVWRFGVGTVGGRMIFDPQMGGSDQYPKIPVILTVVVLRCDLLAVFRPCGEDKGCAQTRSAPPVQARQTVAAVAGDDAG